MNLGLSHLDTPVGPVELVFDDHALMMLEFALRKERTRSWLERRLGGVKLCAATDPFGVKERMRRYFEGDLEALCDLPVQGNGSPFQEQVWAALRQIPPGHTTTYGALASQLGKPQASRAVGAANGANPISIIIPCHRVVGCNGQLTGYGGGVERKRWLLRHEGAAVGQP